jgi:hypothetical protein
MPTSLSIRAKIVGLFVVVAILGGASFGVRAKPTQAATGGIDINRWCQVISQGTERAVLISNNVYGWRCQYTWYGLKLYSIDLNAACRYEYNRSNATAHFYNYSNPYSWYCLY